MIDQQSALPGVPDDTKDVPCAYCHASIVGADFLLCRRCEVPVHRDCWQQTRKCPAFACAEPEMLEPALALFRRSRQNEVVAIAGGASDLLGALIQRLEALYLEVFRRMLRRTMGSFLALGFLLATKPLGSFVLAVFGTIWLFAASIWATWASACDRRLGTALRAHLDEVRLQRVLVERGIASTSAVLRLQQDDKSMTSRLH